MRKHTTQGIAILVAAVTFFHQGCDHSVRPAEVSEADRAKAASRTFGMNVTAPGKMNLNGKVTHASKPITCGRVMFYYANGPIPVPATIQRDGTYVARALEPGKARVVVMLNPQGDLPVPKPTASGKPTPPKVNPQVPGALTSQRSSVQPAFVKQLTDYTVAPSDVEMYRTLHKKYSSPKSKDLPEVEIGPGMTTFDIDLK